MGVRLTMVWRWISGVLLTLCGPPASWSDTEGLAGTLVALDWAEDHTLATPLTVGEGERTIERAFRLRRQLQVRQAVDARSSTLEPAAHELVFGALAQRQLEPTGPSVAESRGTTT